jgi:hypothetical protein
MTFDGTKNFEYCIIDESKILNSYNTIKSLFNTTRDCSTKCFDHIREKGTDPHKCELVSCFMDTNLKYYYNFHCHENCPSKTLSSSNNEYICEFFNCPKYYNFTQKGCIDKIPEGYFSNSSYSKTIDKCHSNCKTCNQKYSTDNNKCQTCPSEKFYYGGDCVDNCQKGYYIDNSKTKCYCTDERCLECSSESLRYKLCISCNKTNNYYPIMYKNKNSYEYINFINCSTISPPGFYFDSDELAHKLDSPRRV